VPTDIRVLDPKADAEAAMRLFRTAAMEVPPTAEDVDLDRVFYEQGQFHGAFVDGRFAGVAGMLPFEMTLPGGARLPMRGITAVGVLPTHTRRGLLTSLMRAQLDAIVAERVPIATLRASEAVIYGRFGYGSANSVQNIEVERARGVFAQPLVDPGSVELVERTEAIDVLPPLHDRIARDRPGAIDRAPWFQQRWQQQVLTATGGYERYWIVVHRDAAGELDGYLTYGALEPDREASGARLQPFSFFAGSSTARAALWRHLLDVDLSKVVLADHRPMDEPILWLLRDRRAAKVTGVHDEIWLRLVDVERGLAARAYAGHEAVVLGVTDPFLRANDGSYLVTPEGVARTDEAPELTLDVSALGAAYLGGHGFTALAAGQRITEHAPGALARADRLFHSAVSPFCGTFF